MELGHFQMILPKCKAAALPPLAWALRIVIGKYRVVQDLKDSNESELATLFLCTCHHQIRPNKNIHFPKPTRLWYITGNNKHKLAIRNNRNVFAFSFVTCLNYTNLGILFFLMTVIMDTIIDHLMKIILLYK